MCCGDHRGRTHESEDSTSKGLDRCRLPERNKAFQFGRLEEVNQLVKPCTSVFLSFPRIFLWSYELNADNRALVEAIGLALLTKTLTIWLPYIVLLLLLFLETVLF